MKKLLLVLFCFCLSLSLFATGLETSYFNFGVGLAVSGRSDATSAVSINATYVPFELNYGNPSLSAWGTASWDGKSAINFNEVGLALSVEIGNFRFNPLSFASNNPTPWAPSVTVGVLYNKVEEEKKASPKLYLEVAIFRIKDKDYTFEWFSPFVLMNKEHKLWGVTVLRFTPLYHLGKEEQE